MRRTDRVGGSIEIRSHRRGDTEVLARLFEQLSARSRYLRFLSPMPRLPGALLELLADTSDTGHVGLIAFRGERPIGEARFVRSPTDADTADVAITVVDDEQGRGVARLLVDELVVEAARHGVCRFTFDVSPENGRLLTALRRCGARMRVVGGVVTGAVDIRALIQRRPRPAAA